MRSKLLLLSGLFCSVVSAQVTIVEKGIARSSIITRSDDQNTAVAQDILVRFIQEISGVDIRDSRDSVVDIPYTVLLDNQVHNRQLGIMESGYRIDVYGNRLIISAGGDKGIIYGVVELLERYCGVKYLAPHQYQTIPAMTIVIPEVSILDNPSFRYRQTQMFGIVGADSDSLYKYWHRLDIPQEVFIKTHWVHTFEKILPTAEFGESHPEYFSYFEGKRHPGKASQWCLTNDDLFEEVCKRLEMLMEADPAKHIISVSQNDSNFTNCTCDQCSAIDTANESPSGSLIYFMNKLAARFPDKTISTLAYLYSMNPPKVIKPLPNVNIMLCSIDADREVPLTDNKSGRAFVSALKGWSEMSNNLFVWDYGINFDNYLSPFPNFHVLKANMKLFHEHGTTMHFSQIGGARGCNFAELRAYMVSKLLWNVNADAEAIMLDFLQAYYGDASAFILEYIKTMEASLLKSGDRLWIYDSPVSFKNGILLPGLMSRYEELFERAEAAVEYDSTLLARVQIAGMPLLYSYLEIARTEAQRDVAEVEKRLIEFEKRVKKYDISTLNERNNHPIDYVKEYRERHLNKTVNIASNKKVQYITPPQAKYQVLGETALTDGLYGGTTFTDSWIGWEGEDGAFIIDLERYEKFTIVSLDFLHQLGAWILLPRMVHISYSFDNVTYSPFGSVSVTEDRSPTVKFVNVDVHSKESATARYIRVEINGTNTCPDWHYGVGRNCWFFIDEVKVR